MLPPFTEKGDLPPGIHPAGWSEIEQRFGAGSGSRANAYAKLRHLHELAEPTGPLERFLVACRHGDSVTRNQPKPASPFLNVY